MLPKQFLYLEGSLKCSHSEIGQSFVVVFFGQIYSTLTERFLKIILVPDVREKADKNLTWHRKQIS